MCDNRRMKLPSEKHLTVAARILDGHSLYKALREGGYSHYVARHPGELIRGSAPLRAAIRMEIEKRGHKLVPRPKRRRYDRAPTVRNVNDYVLPEDDSRKANQYLGKLHHAELVAESIANGTPRPAPFQVQDFALILCPSCGRKTRQSQLLMNQWQTGYCCTRCCIDAGQYEARREAF